MPVHEGHDEVGHFFQWGDRGKKYYFETHDDASRDAAEQAARRQERAARARGYGKT